MFRELPNEYSHFSRISKKAMKAYILGFDQSTSNTKAMLFDESGELAARVDLPHKQIINELGWVEHNPEEILSNLFASIGQLLGQTGIDRSLIKAVTISNQRETALAWDRAPGSHYSMRLSGNALGRRSSARLWMSIPLSFTSERVCTFLRISVQLNLLG